jgi:DNA-binding MarR family transcriptional regulator
MSKKQDFISEVNGMINSLGYEWQSESAKSYWEAFISVKEEDKPEFTDNGKLILKYMQDNSDKDNFKAKDIGEGLFVSSRTVSGAIRKLVTDGYVEKIGQDPVIYTLTEKGKNKEIV